MRILKRIERIRFFERQEVARESHHFKIAAQALTHALDLTANLLVDRRASLAFTLSGGNSNSLFVLRPEDVRRRFLHEKEATALRVPYQQ